MFSVSPLAVRVASNDGTVFDLVFQGYKAGEYSYATLLSRFTE